MAEGLAKVKVSVSAGSGMRPFLVVCLRNRLERQADASVWHIPAADITGEVKRVRATLSQIKSATDH